MQLVRAHKADLLIVLVKADGFSLAAFRCSRAGLLLLVGGAQLLQGVQAQGLLGGAEGQHLLLLCLQLPTQLPQLENALSCCQLFSQ